MSNSAGFVTTVPDLSFLNLTGSDCKLQNQRSKKTVKSWGAWGGGFQVRLETDTAVYPVVKPGTIFRRKQNGPTATDVDRKSKFQFSDLISSLTRCFKSIFYSMFWSNIALEGSTKVSYLHVFSMNPRVSPGEKDGNFHFEDISGFGSSSVQQRLRPLEVPWMRNVEVETDSFAISVFHNDWLSFTMLPFVEGLPVVTWIHYEDLWTNQDFLAAWNLWG